MDIGRARTVFLIVEDLKVPLGALGEGLSHHGHGVLGGERAMEEIADGRPLHHLGPREAGEATEAVRAVNDMARLLRGGQRRGSSGRSGLLL